MALRNSLSPHVRHYENRVKTIIGGHANLNLSSTFGFKHTSAGGAGRATVRRKHFYSLVFGPKAV